MVSSFARWPAVAEACQRPSKHESLDEIRHGTVPLPRPQRRTERTRRGYRDGGTVELGGLVAAGDSRRLGVAGFWKVPLPGNGGLRLARGGDQ